MDELPVIQERNIAIVARLTPRDETCIDRIPGLRDVSPDDALGILVDHYDIPYESPNREEYGGSAEGQAEYDQALASAQLDALETHPEAHRMYGCVLHLAGERLVKALDREEEIIHALTLPLWDLRVG